MFAPNKIWVAKIAAIFKCPCLNHSHLGVRYNYYTFYLFGGGYISYSSWGMYALFCDPSATKV